MTTEPNPNDTIRELLRELEKHMLWLRHESHEFVSHYAYELTIGPAWTAFARLNNAVNEKLDAEEAPADPAPQDPPPSDPPPAEG